MFDANFFHYDEYLTIIAYQQQSLFHSNNL